MHRNVGTSPRFLILAAVAALTASLLLAPSSQASPPGTSDPFIAGTYKGRAQSSGSLGILFQPAPPKSSYKVQAGKPLVCLDGFNSCGFRLRTSRHGNYLVKQKRARLFVGSKKPTKVLCTDVVTPGGSTPKGRYTRKVRLFAKALYKDGRVKTFNGKIVRRIKGCPSGTRTEVTRLRNMKFVRP